MSAMDVSTMLCLLRTKACGWGSQQSSNANYGLHATYSQEQDR